MITVGVTELHGIAKEAMTYPPEGIQYVETFPRRSFSEKILTSPAKGVWHRFDGANCDIIEAPLFPIRTKKPWIYTPASFAAMTTFGLAGLPLPRAPRISFCSYQMKKNNFKALVFKSETGRATAESYGRISDEKLLEKIHVVYPAIRQVEDDLIRYSSGPVRFLCSGDFFSKGSASVVDAFEQLQKIIPNISLQVCAPLQMPAGDHKLRDYYQSKINNNPAITLGPVTREHLLDTLLPNTDVFVSPTFHESFGFAILEACAYGIPVISTARFAIPEIVEHEVGGFLVPIEQFDFIDKGSTGTVHTIPKSFHDYLTKEVLSYMKVLAVDAELRANMGRAALKRARQYFSFDKRNASMSNIYREAIE